MEVSDYVAIREGRRKSELETAKEDGKMEAKIEIAKNLLDILDNETISIKTGLDIQIIENLRKKQNQNKED
jgi:dsDNA-binding SOS-regulon protein